MYRFRIRILLAMLAVLALSPTVSAQSRIVVKPAATIEPPISLAFDLATGPEVGVGEPVIVRYTLRTSLGGPVFGTIRDRPSNTAIEIAEPIRWYTVDLTGPHGLPVTRFPALPRISLGGIRALPMMLVYRGSIHNGDLLVNRLFDIRENGAYTLTIHVNFPYIDMGTRDNGIPEDFVNQISTSSTVIHKDFTFHLTVSDSTPERQHAMSEQLLNSYYGGPDSAMREFYLDSLLSLPEKSAGSAWRSLALNWDIHALDRLKVAVALCDTGTATAAEILIEMYQNPSLDFGESALFPVMLVKRIYLQGSPNLKSRIEALAKQHSVSLPVGYGFGD